MLRTGMIVVMLVACLAGMARATPPQVVSVTDSLFGLSQTHIFLLRNLEDNMGRYGMAQTDVLLIARNRMTNVDDEIWPVARSIFYDADIAGDGAAMKVEALPVAGLVNPFDIVAAKGARLMLGTRAGAVTPPDGTVMIEDAAVVLADLNTDQTFRLDYGQIDERITASLNATRDALPAYLAEGGFDALEGVAFDVGTECAFEGYVALWDGIEGRSWLAEVRCENDETLAPVSTFLEMRLQE
ncbi:MAG: hypothetical protein ACRC6I_10480 [Paracoccaceae bacterium]